MACLITLSACEFGKAPDMSKFQETNTVEDECDETCQQNFKAMLEKKYGANWDVACDDNCINTEWNTFQKSLETGSGDLMVDSGTPKENVKAPVTNFKYPEECDIYCQIIFTKHVDSFYGDTCDDACQKAAFDIFFEVYASLYMSQGGESTDLPTPPPPTEKTGNANAGAQNQDSEQENTSPTTPNTPTAPVDSPVSKPVVLPPTFQVDPDEINSHIAKLGFAPDTVVILSPKYALSSLDALKQTVILPTAQQMLIDMLPTLMIRAKYLLLAYKKNTTNYSFIIVSPDAVTNRLLDVIIMKLYQDTSASRGILKIGTDIGLTKITNTYIVGSPFSQIEAILKGTLPAILVTHTAIAPCISVLKGKQFDGFIAKQVIVGENKTDTNPLLKYFGIPVAEQIGPNNATCWYKMK